MSRVKRGKTVKKRHKKILQQVKGFRGVRKHRIKLAKEALLKAGFFSYRDRRTKKRSFRQLWISKINAALKRHDLTYSTFIRLLKDAHINLNRKILADLAENHPDEFSKIVTKVKPASQKDQDTD